MNHLSSREAYEKLEQASSSWANAEEKEIILKNGCSAMFAKCFMKHKKFCSTTKEAEYQAELDPEYQQIVSQYAVAKKELISAKMHYNNLDRYSSMKQTEAKIDVALTTQSRA